MQRHGDAIPSQGFAVRHGLNGSVVAQTRAQQRLTLGGGQVLTRSRQRVVAMLLGDGGAVDRRDRVDVEMPVRPIQARLANIEHIIIVPRLSYDPSLTRAARIGPAAVRSVNAWKPAGLSSWPCGQP